MDSPISRAAAFWETTHGQVVGHEQWPAPLGGSSPALPERHCGLDRFLACCRGPSVKALPQALQCFGGSCPSSLGPPIVSVEVCKLCSFEYLCFKPEALQCAEQVDVSRLTRAARIRLGTQCHAALGRWTPGLQLRNLCIRHDPLDNAAGEGDPRFCHQRGYCSGAHQIACLLQRLGTPM